MKREFIMPSMKVKNFDRINTAELSGVTKNDEQQVTAALETQMSGKGTNAGTKRMIVW